MSFIIVIIALALIFDFINGFHDAANSIATIVSTKVLTPFQAVVWAAIFNFAAFFIFKDHGVADTVSKTVNSKLLDKNIMLIVVFSGLIAAIAWNLLTWWFGIPSSSSHTLIGGFAGANNVVKTTSPLLFPFGNYLDLKPGGESTLFITCDANDWFINPWDIKIADNPAINTPGLLATQVAENYMKMFTIDSVSNIQ